MQMSIWEIIGDVYVPMGHALLRVAMGSPNKPPCKQKTEILTYKSVNFREFISGNNSNNKMSTPPR